MAILPIVLYPNPILKTVCDPVGELSGEVLRFADDLVETLESNPGCVGIAAPQVSMTKRIIVVDASRGRKPVPNHGRLVLINPVIESQEGEVVGREGCLSLPHLTANVKRAQHIRFRAITRDGGSLSLEASDFEARVILHEYDHLDGLLFLDRVSSLKTDVFRRKDYMPKTPG